MSSTDKKEISKHISNEDALSNLLIDRSFITSTRENVAASFDNERRLITTSRHIPLIPADKLHRRNPLTVRQEIQSFDDIVPETTLADLQLSEMPGLQNTEQWKRIAARSGQLSPPLSRQYYQTATPVLGLQNEQMPKVLGSYRRPGRTENEQNILPVVPPPLPTSRRRILFGLLITIIIIAIVVAVVVAVILVRKPKETTTDYYSGYIIVQAYFDPVLSSSSTTLTKNYQREFCSLIENTLSDAKTKYAIFYSDCEVNKFRSGSIIADFILGFTRYQNVTRLNGFLNRMLINKQLFGGTILSIIFNSTTDMNDNNNNSTDYDTDYDENQSTNLLMFQQDILTSSTNKQQIQITYTTTEKALISFEDLTSRSTLITNQSKQFHSSNILKRQKRIQRHLLQDKLMSFNRLLYYNNPSISFSEIDPDSLLKTHEQKLRITKRLTSSNNLPIFKSIKTKKKSFSAFHNTFTLNKIGNDYKNKRYSL